MRFDYQYGGVSEKELAKQVDALTSYKEHLKNVADAGEYKEAESSISLPHDDEHLSDVHRVAESVGVDRVKYIFVIGIGGSNLGTKAVYDAVYGFFDAYDFERTPKIFFIDTTNSRTLIEARQFIKTYVREPEEVLVNIISKSGGTTETIANAEFILEALHERLEDHPAVLSRIVVTTDMFSALSNAAAEKGIAVLSIPKLVGGRYSVFSTVGLLPLFVAGCDVEGFLLGARHAVQHAFRDATDSDDAMRSAIILAENLKNGFTINDNFIFNQEMESFGKWYRQLMGESVGKEKNRKKKKVHTGLTPTVSVGSTDLHSVGQLYLGGPKDKITTFIWSGGGESLKIPNERMFPELVLMINGARSYDVLRAILEGTQAAYRKNKLPYTEIVLNEVNEYELGTLMQFKMLEMMYLGELLDVNAFDQPNVEAYKKETKKILEEGS